MTSQSALRDLAARVHDLDKRIKAKGSTPQLAYSTIENGALRAHSDIFGETMRIGLQWDGTYAPTTTNGPVPSTPSDAQCLDATEGIVIGWDGTFGDGSVTPMDFLRVDAHVGALDTFIPDHTNRVGSFNAPQGGTLSVTLPYGTYFVKLVCWTFAGKVSAASGPVECDSFPVTVTTDGFAPSASPDPFVVQGIDAMYVRWTAITNADPVTYDVHVSPTLGFTADSTTLVGSTGSSAFTIKQLPGPEPADGEDDPRVLQYETPYYVRVIARDDDGSAPESLQAVGGVFQVTGINLAVDSVAAANIVTGSLTGDLFSATVIYAGTFKTAESGQRVETGIAGIQGYKSDGSLMINFPTDSSQTALIDAEIIARGLTVTNGMVLRSTSTVEPDGVIKLNRGIAPPVSTPQMSKTYTSRQPATYSLTSAQKTGSLGTFDLISSEVSCIEWKDASDVWVIHQIRPNGTRAWFFDFDGNPVAWSGGAYFADYVNWEIWSVIEITTSSAPKNGVYRMARWIPAGAANTYYLMCPQGGGFNRYSRVGSQPPVVGTNGTDVFVAEVPVSNPSQLWIRYYTPNGDGNNVSAPTTVYQSANASFNSNRPLAAVSYEASGFDTGAGAPRYLVAERGGSIKNKIVYTSGTNAGSIHPSGVTAGPSSWSSTNIDAHTFEAAANNTRCVAWMPGEAAFWTYDGDSNLYEHTGTFWDPAVTSSTVWAQQSFYDSVGTTHETTPGPAKSYSWPRRSKIAFSLPPMPGAGGVDDPNNVRVYAGRGASQPSNSNMWLQITTTVPTAVLGSLATSGSNPLTASTFPNTNPGKVQNDDASLVISGDGTIKIGGKDVALGAPVEYLITASGTWTKPAGLKAAYVEAVGGSGGSGGCAGTTGQAESGGGGGGSFAAKWYLGSDISATESVTIGAAGNAGNTAGTDGTAGGSTLFKGLTAGPGGGGAGVTTRAATITAAGGTGGTATGGDINTPGEAGGIGRTITSLALLQARGGQSHDAPGAGARTGAGANAGIFPGGGAGGCFAGAAVAAGAAGAAGWVRIRCYF